MVEPSAEAPLDIRIFVQAKDLAETASTAKEKSSRMEKCFLIEILNFVVHKGNKKHPMRKFISTLAILAAMIPYAPAIAQSQEIDPIDLASKMVDQLIKDYDIDVAQAFKVDTMLQNSYTAYYAELDKLTKSGAVTSQSYQYLSDKWGDYIDKAFEKIFTTEQWNKYMKGDNGKNKKKRDKRLAELQDAINK